MSSFRISSFALALIALTLATGLIYGSAASADTIGLTPVPTPGDGGWVTPVGNDYLSIQLDRRYVSDDATIPLRELLGITHAYRGRQVQYVVLTASTDAGRGQARLEINGQQVGPVQIVSTYMSDYYFDPGYGAVIDDVIQSLQLHLNGHFTVESVGVQLY